MKTVSKRTYRYLLLSFVITCLAIFTPGDGKIAGNYLDKIAHFLLFANLAFSVCYTFREIQQRFEILFWMIVFGLFSEVIQQFISGRNMDIYDGIADTLGVIVGYYLHKILNN